VPVAADVGYLAAVDVMTVWWRTLHTAPGQSSIYCPPGPYPTTCGRITQLPAFATAITGKRFPPPPLPTGGFWMAVCGQYTPRTMAAWLDHSCGLAVLPCRILRFPPVGFHRTYSYHPAWRTTYTVTTGGGGVTDTRLPHTWIQRCNFANLQL